MTTVGSLFTGAGALCELCGNGVVPQQGQAALIHLLPLLAAPLFTDEEATRGA